MPPEDSTEYRWFVENVKPHERLLHNWLRAQYPTARDIDDLVQEAFIRVLRAHQEGGVKSPKAFLFATARNLVLMQMRHQRVTGSNELTENDLTGILDDNSNVRDEVALAQELQLLAQFIQSLPTRCRQIVTLRKIYGLPQKEVAAALGISEHTVEAQSRIAFRKLVEHFEQIERRGSPGHE